MAQVEAQASTNGVVGHLEAQVNEERSGSVEEQRPSRTPEESREEQNDEEEEQEEEEEDSDDVRGSLWIECASLNVFAGHRNYHGATISFVRFSVSISFMHSFIANEVQHFIVRQRNRQPTVPTTPSKRMYSHILPHTDF